MLQARAAAGFVAIALLQLPPSDMSEEWAACDYAGGSGKAIIGPDGCQTAAVR